MGAFLSWQPKVGPSESLFFDVVTEEVQTLTSTMTEHPVESDANIADHIRTDLERVTLEAFVSNTPIDDQNGFYGFKLKPLRLDPSNLGLASSKLSYSPPLEPTPGSVFGAIGGAIKGLLGKSKPDPTATVFQADKDFDAITDTIKVLEALRASKQLVKVVCPSRLYNNMFLEKLVVQRNARSGSGATFHLEFKQVKKVETKLVTAPIPTELRGASEVKKGAQAVKEVKNEETKKSIAKAGAGDRVKRLIDGIRGR